MNRFVKKTLAAVFLGVAGTVGGAVIGGVVWGPELMENMQSPCGQTMIENYRNFSEIKNPTEQDAMAVLEKNEALPCYQEMQNVGLISSAKTLGLGFAGFTAGLVLVGRKKKEGPTPS